LTCKKCGANRIITRQRVLCPHCEGLIVKKKEETISNLSKELEDLNHALFDAISSTNYNVTFGSALLNRELAANACIYSAPQRRYALNEWLVYTYLLHNLRFVKDGEKKLNFLELVSLSREIVRLHNERCSLKQDMAMIIESEGKQSFEWTELEPLSFIPEEACVDSDSKPILDGITDRDLHTDIALLQEGLMLPIQILLLSEEISRMLRQCYHSRIFPFVKNPVQARIFVKISAMLSTEGLDYNSANKRAPQEQGFVLVDKNGLQFIRERICKKFPSAQVDWYMNGLLRDNPDNYGIGSSIIVKDEEKGIFCLPLYSLQMLAIANMKWMKEADLGYASNYKGGVVEDYFFRLFNAYDISSINPKTGEPFIRVKHPDNPSIEIADVMGFNDKYVALLECKFWNAPTLRELEKELQRFRQRSEFIEKNLKKFNLSEELEVVPLFYTPYAPYSVYDKIVILPSIFGIGEKLSELFPTKKIKLLTETEGLETLFDSCADYPMPFPLDAAQLNNILQPNTFNVHDGLVLKYDKEEITLLIDIPVSLYGCLVYFDITETTFDALRKERVSKGDIIRMVTVNLNGTWSLTQLACFRKLVNESEWTSNVQKYSDYRKMIRLYTSFRDGKSIKKTTEDKKVSLTSDKP
jgi:hypothetical protein